MRPEQKILKVLHRIKDKTDISPAGAIIDYQAGLEVNELNAEDEISILNKLEQEGVIDVIENYSSEYI